MVFLVKKIFIISLDSVLSLVSVTKDSFFSHVCACVCVFDVYDSEIEL